MTLTKTITYEREIEETDLIQILQEYEGDVSDFINDIDDWEIVDTELDGDTKLEREIEQRIEKAEQEEADRKRAKKRARRRGQTIRRRQWHTRHRRQNSVATGHPHREPVRCLT